MFSRLQTSKRVLTAAALTFGMVGGGVALASPASAANPYVWNDVRGSVQIYYLPNQDASNYFNVPNGERVVMNCWLDNTGHRWFKVQTFNYGWGYVWANWTYNQVPTPRC